ncbi:DUF1788 domain-containing protein [Ligilactobacillus equi]|uniref:DUF1788 domain-containing protein n=1 Tax=Ligilactobacillus equi TaxID=137357 RepID=UPI002ED2147C
MVKTLEEKILILKDRILEDGFLRNEGLSNEVGYYIFDYQPQDEMKFRSELREFYQDSQVMKKLKIREFNLYDIVLKYLDSFGYRDIVDGLEEKKGFAYLSKQFDNVLKMEENHNEIVKYIEKETRDVVKGDGTVIFITGVGEIFPLLRAHNLLNTMHQIVNYCPVILFFPGEYDGLHLKTLGKVEDNNYYRAFPIE